MFHLYLKEGKHTHTRVTSFSLPDHPQQHAYIDMIKERKEKERSHIQGNGKEEDVKATSITSENSKID